MIWHTLHTFVLGALLLAACSTATSGTQAVDTHSDSALDVATDAATGDATGDATGELLADAATATDVDFVADTALDATVAGDEGDTAPAAGDASATTSDGGAETAAIDDTQAVDSTADSEVDSGSDGAADGAADADASKPDVCTGGLAECPKSADGPPGAPLAWADASCLAPLSPDWVDAGLNATPDLTVAIGPSTVASTWAPYVDGSWAPLYHGTQGLVHTEVAIRVTGTGLTAPQYTASVMRVGYIGCNAKTNMTPFAVSLIPQADGSYFSSNGGMLAVWDMGINSWKYCGQWAEIHVTVRIPDGRWGEGKVRLHLWDTAPTCPPP